MENLGYLEIKYGKIDQIDLHGLTKEEAKAELINKLLNMDINYKGLLVTHGYHMGVVLKNFIRNEFKFKSVSMRVEPFYS